MILLATYATPNPLALQFEFDQPFATDLPLVFESDHRPPAPAAWWYLFQIPGVRHVLAHDCSITIVKTPEPEWVELAELIRRSFLEHPLDPMLQDFDPLPYVRSIANSLLPSLNEWYTRTIAPATARDGGFLTLADTTTPQTLHFEAIGACLGCPYAKQTIEQGILKRLTTELPTLQGYVLT
jgi:Fe-S cluster biogenesis protein NfuA